MELRVGPFQQVPVQHPWGLGWFSERKTKDNNETHVFGKSSIWHKYFEARCSTKTQLPIVWYDVLTLGPYTGLLRGVRVSPLASCTLTSCDETDMLSAVNGWTPWKHNHISVNNKSSVLSTMYNIKMFQKYFQVFLLRFQIINVKYVFQKNFQSVFAAILNIKYVFSGKKFQSVFAAILRIIQNGINTQYLPRWI